MGKKCDSMTWAGLFHMGVNMWSDQPVDSWGPYKGEQLKLVCKADHLRFDENVWRAITKRMADVGMNMVVIDLGEAVKYPSHPELFYSRMPKSVLQSNWYYGAEFDASKAGGLAAKRQTLGLSHGTKVDQ